MNKHRGSTLDSLFDELGETSKVELLTQKKLISARIAAAMKRRRISKSALARDLKTSRTAISRLLDPNYTGVTLTTLWKVSQALDIRLVRVA